jgi:phage-related protein
VKYARKKHSFTERDALRVVRSLPRIDNWMQFSIWVQINAVCVERMKDWLLSNVREDTIGTIIAVIQSLIPTIRNIIRMIATIYEPKEWFKRFF